MIPPTDLILNPDGSVYHLNLRPENIAHTIIAVGDPDRVTKVSRHFDEIHFQANKREFVTHTGTYHGKRITVISTGIGTDNVEIFFNEIDALVNIDLNAREPKTIKQRLRIIRIGTSGALQKNIPLGAHLISDYGIGLDNLIGFYELAMGTTEQKISKAVQTKTGLPFTPYTMRGSNDLRKSIGFDIIQGNTVTCPGFYAPQGRVLRLPIRFPELLEDLNEFCDDDFRITNFEMETAAYYAFGKLLGHDVTSANVIIANRITREFMDHHDEAMDALIKKVLDRV